MFGLDTTTAALIVAAILVVVFWPKIAETFGNTGQQRQPTNYGRPVEYRPPAEIEVEPPLKDEVKALLNQKARLEDELNELRKILQEDK